MADELVKKRITEYGTEVAVDELDNSDVIFIDSTQHGTRKFRLKGIRDTVDNIKNEGIKSSGVSVTADNYATTITNVDNQPVNTIYVYAAGLQSSITNLPSNVALNIMHYTYKYSVATNVGQVMIAIERSGENPSMYFRTTSGTPVSWGNWVKIANADDLNNIESIIERLSDNAELVYSIKASNNLFDYNNCELGDFNSAGNEVDSTTVMRTIDMVPISGDYVVSNYNCRKIFYDSSFNPILRSASTTEAVTIPENAVYVRFTIAKSVYDSHNDIMVNVGTELLPYEPFKYEIELNDEIIEKSKYVNDVKDELLRLSPELKSTNNLFDYNNCELGDFNSAGNEVDSTTVMRTIDMVPISGDYVVSNYNCRKIFYDSSFNPILRSASTTEAVTIPENAVYVRFTIAKSNYDSHNDIMVNVGTELLPYEPYCKFRTISVESFDDGMQNSRQNQKQLYYSELYKIFKRVGVIGDSLSVGYTKNPITGETLIRNLNYSWVKCVGRDAHTDWLNFGTTGQTVLTWCSSSQYGKVQMESENNKCQAYIIGLGENDYGEVPLGDVSDITDDPDTVATTYYGGYVRIIQLIKRLNTDAKIFCFTNPRESTARKPFNDAVRYIAGTYYKNTDNVYLVDLAKEYSHLFEINTPLYIDKQAVSHYSSAGYQMLSKINEEAISKVMLNYQLDFLTVPFIPYDTGTPTADTMTE